MEDNKWAFKYIIFCLYITLFLFEKHYGTTHAW